MGIDFGRGLHARSGHSIDVAAYDGYVGRWSRLFVPAVLAAAEITRGDRVLDGGVGPGEAALMALPIVEPSGCVIDLDISEPMLLAARSRIASSSFRPVAANGQALPFANATFDAVVCQLSLQFFPDPATGLEEFRRVLRAGRCATVCTICEPDRAPMWGILADTLSRYLPTQREMLHLSFSLPIAERLEGMLRMAGFRDVAVARETRQGTIESFDDYWADVEAGIGMMPQAYLALSDTERRSVREELHMQLSKFEYGGGLVMSVDMLIGSGRA
jgi:ubiquinone/menaquinone biosynthesis C-methylase UbiE